MKDIQFYMCRDIVLSSSWHKISQPLYGWKIFNFV